MLELFLTFLKIGAFTFGGGYAMIPLVTEAGLAFGLTEAEIMNLIAVAESTPGPIAINMATFIGSTCFGFWGSVLATLGVVLPSFIIILIIACLVQNLMKFAGVQGFLSGVRPVVVGLIVGTGVTLFLSVVLSLKTVNDAVIFDWRALVIFAIITGVSVLCKKVLKKNISAILLIIIAACLGMLLYGVLGTV